MLKGEVPVFDVSYDLSDPAGTAMTAAGAVVGGIMMFAFFGLARAGYNRLSQQTDAINEVELL